MSRSENFEAGLVRFISSSEIVLLGTARPKAELKLLQIAHCTFALIETNPSRNLISKLSVAPADREGLRIFVILPLSGLFENPKLFTELHCPFGSSFIYLPENASTTLEKAERRLPQTLHRKLQGLLPLASRTRKTDLQF